MSHSLPYDPDVRRAQTAPGPAGLVALVPLAAQVSVSVVQAIVLQAVSVGWVSNSRRSQRAIFIGQPVGGKRRRRDTRAP